MYAPEHWSGSCRTGCYGPVICMGRPSVVCLSVMFVQRTQRVEFFGNVLVPSNSLGIRTVSVKILERN